ncbi:MAG: hypothetical protein KA190_16750 [Kofleriaceae bacterium]|nr:hypothetical protein [Kofleriaceae bacterium]
MVVLLAAGAGAWPARPATACTPPEPSWSVSYPADGEVGVPTNPVVRVAVNGPWGSPDVGAQLIDDQGLPVETLDIPSLALGRGSYVLRLQPSMPLRPGSTYAVTVCPSPPTGGACDPATRTELARFTTGAEPDLVPPTFAGGEGYSLGAFEVGDGFGSCGRYTVQQLRFDYGPVSDDRGQIGFIVYRADGDRGAVGAGLHAIYTFFASGSDAYPGNSGFDIRPGRYLVRAVDRAGNEDDNQAVVVIPELDPPLPPVIEADVIEPAGCTGGRGQRGAGALLILAAWLSVRGRGRRGWRPGAARR